MLTVIMRGIGHRPGRSAILLLLAIAATAAAVLTPGYTRAAQESLLYDELRAEEGTATMATFTAYVTGAGGDMEAADGVPIEGNEDFDRYPEYLSDIVESRDDLSAFENPIGFIRTNVEADGRYRSFSSLAYRQDSCDHITMVDGECATEEEQVLISERSAKRQELEVGDQIDLKNTEAYAGEEAEYEIAGVYRPERPDDPYWGRTGHFGYTHVVAGDATPYIDSLLVTDPSAFEPIGERVRAGVEYSLDIDEVNLSNVAERVSGLGDLETTQTSAHPDDPDADIRWQADATLPAMVDEIGSEQDAIASAVPVVAIPLVLMCWFVLFLMVAHIVEERGPELGVAKLRGHRAARLRFFGLGEVLILIVLAAPLGVLAGLGVVKLVAWALLAPGTTVVLDTQVVWYAVAALAGAIVAARLASRGAIRRPVMDLLRRVPARGRRRTWVVEAILATLSAAALYQVLSSPKFGDFGLLVTPLLALLAGLIIARVMTALARRGIQRAMRRGALTRMLMLARLGRRGEWHRVVVLVTVAVALLTFGVATWDIAERNRQLSADDRYGAETVYQLSAVEPGALMDAVARLDPSGERLAGVLRSFQRYGDRDFNEVAVQSERFAAVADWRGHDDADLADSAKALRPSAPEHLEVTGDLTIDATVDDIESDEPPKLAVRVIAADGEIETLRMEEDELSEGAEEYTVKLPDCDDGCRLLGVGIGRYAGDFSGIDVAMEIDEITDDDGAVDAGLGDGGRWRSASDTPADVPLEVTSSGDSVRLEAETDSYQDMFAEYASIPREIPVALAGDVPSQDPRDTTFEFLAPHGELQNYEVVENSTVVPRGGPQALLADLEYTGLAAEPYGTLTNRDDVSFEIWSSEAPDESISQRLSAMGITVKDVQRRSDYLAQLSRGAPALAFQLNLLAGGAALALTVGTVVLTTSAGSAARGRDNAGLRVAGVSERTLRRAMRREFLRVIAVPLAAGVGCGLLGAWVILPRLSLVSTQPPPVGPEYWPGPWWLPGGLALAVALLLATTLGLARAQRKRGHPDRLREGEQ